MPDTIPTSPTTLLQSAIDDIDDLLGDTVGLSILQDHLDAYGYTVELDEHGDAHAVHEPAGSCRWFSATPSGRRD